MPHILDGFNYCERTQQQQVDILLSKNQALQVLYLKHYLYEIT